MQEVLIITGACGVGKTTLAKAWAKHKNGAIIECDFLTEWIYQKDFPNWTSQEEQFTAQLSAVMAKEYLRMGMSVAIENVWTPAGIALLWEQLENLDELKIKAVWLVCERAENHRRDELRVPEDQMKERVDMVNEELASYEWPVSVHQINTSTITVEDTLGIIEELPDRSHQ